MRLIRELLWLGIAAALTLLIQSVIFGLHGIDPRKFSEINLYSTYFVVRNIFLLAGLFCLLLFAISTVRLLWQGFGNRLFNATILVATLGVMVLFNQVGVFAASLRESGFRGLLSPASDPEFIFWQNMANGASLLQLLLALWLVYAAYRMGRAQY